CRWSLEDAAESDAAAEPPGRPRPSTVAVSAPLGGRAVLFSRSDNGVFSLLSLLPIAESKYFCSSESAVLAVFGRFVEDGAGDVVGKVSELLELMVFGDEAVLGTVLCRSFEFKVLG